MKDVEHQRVPSYLVKQLVEETDPEKYQVLLQNLTTLLNCVPLEKRVRVFLTWYPETSSSQEKLRQFAVVTLAQQLSYWQFYRSLLKDTSIANYLDMGTLLPLVSHNQSFSAMVVTNWGEEGVPDGESYLRTVSIAGDGDFWNTLAENKIKASVLLDPVYGTNHHPYIFLNELGTSLEQVQKLIQARNTYYQRILDLFGKNMQLQVADGYLPESVLRAQRNPMSIFFTLYKQSGDFDQAEASYAEFRKRFNEYVSETEWNELFSCLDIMITELQKLVKIAYAHT